MAELQPPSDVPVNGASVAGDPATLPAETVAGPTKRQRRPSVRLGEIGDQYTYDHHRRIKPQQWKYTSKDSKSTKTRQLMNLSGAAAAPIEYHETLDPGIEDNDAPKLGNSNANCINNYNSNNNNVNSWRVGDLGKTKRGFTNSKRVRTNWGSKLDDGDDRFEEADDYDDADRYSDYDRDGSGSQMKDQGFGVRVRVSDGVELDGPDADARNGVRVWLSQLGLGRYYPVFELHEVDDEVLPLLTLEDLKDMGINAVGSRRKMFCSIQKLGKGFS